MKLLRPLLTWLRRPAPAPAPSEPRERHLLRVYARALTRASRSYELLTAHHLSRFEPIAR